MSGTPDLRLAARSRAVALPLVQISRRTGTQVQACYAFGVTKQHVEGLLLLRSSATDPIHLKHGPQLQPS